MSDIWFKLINLTEEKIALVQATYQHMCVTNQQLSFNRVQYNTIQYNTIQYNTIQYNTIQILFATAHLCYYLYKNLLHCCISYVNSGEAAVKIP